MIDVFDLTGPEFLRFFFLLSVGGFVLAGLVRWYWRFPGGIVLPTPKLSAPEVALLSGREAGLANATMAALIHTGVLKADAGTRRIRRAGDLPFDAGPLDVAIFHACSATGTRPGEIRDHIQPFARKFVAQLKTHELVLNEGPLLLCSLLPLAIMAMVLVVGCVKIAVGISRDRPVGILVFFCILDLVLSLAAFARPAWRTRRGDAVLSAIRNSQPALKASAQTKGSRLEPGDVMLAFALFGPAILAAGDTRLREFAVTLRPPGQSGGGGGCSSGSGCGGGGGCGGCGGGH